MLRPYYPIVCRTAASLQENPGTTSSPSDVSLILHKCPQPLRCRIPLRRNLIEVPFRLLQPLGVQLPHPLAPAASMVHEAHTPEGVEMLGDRLPRHPRAFAESRNRERAVHG